MNRIHTTSVQLHSGGGFAPDYYGDVQDVTIYPTGFISFTYKSEGRAVEVKSNLKYSVSKVTTLSCGHDVSNYWFEDCLSAGGVDHCKACEAPKDGTTV